MNLATGFIQLAAGVLAGYLLGRTGAVGKSGQAVLTTIVLTVLSPLLLFSIAATSDPGRIVDRSTLVNVTAAMAAAGFAVALAGKVARRSLGETTVIGLSAGYANTSFLGIPIATYVIGDTSVVVPILLAQLIVITPLAVVALEADAATGLGLGKVLLRVFRQPLILATILGTALATAGIGLPGWILGPITSLGAATIPVILIAFGLSLVGQRVLEPGHGRRPIVVAVLAKSLVMPGVAFLAGSLVGLSGPALAAAVIMGALPTAQSIFAYAVHYGRAVPAARDSIFLSTVLSVPIIIAVALATGLNE